jgi:SPP1 gp7 family putative phage head morphogenesis protein
VKFGGTGNEARDLVGLPKMDDPRMDEPLFIGASGATSADPGLTAEDAPAADPATPDPSKGKVEASNDEQDKEDEVSRKAAKRFRKQKQLLDATHQRAVDTHEPDLAAKLLAAREKFERSFWASVKDVKAGTASITRGEVQALERALGDVDGDYADAIYDAQALLAEVGWTQGKALLDLTTGFDVVPAATLKRLRDAADAYESQINLQEKEALRLALVDAFDQGLSVPQTRDLLKETFAEGFHSVVDGVVERRMPSDTWATTVARTELSSAANDGMMSLYADAGVKRIQWVAANSPATCDDCADADGQIVDLGDNFPDVDVPSAPSHPRCVCCTAPADDDLGNFRGDQEQQDRAARGGYSASEYADKFGFDHPLDAKRAGGSPTGKEDY